MSIWATHCAECGKPYLAGSFCYDCEAITECDSTENGGAFCDMLKM